MFKINFKITCAFGFAILLNACFKPVSLDLPEYDNKPVVNCFFTPEEAFKIYVSKTFSRFDTALVMVDDAIVELCSEDGLIAVLPGLGKGIYSDSTLFPQKGILYSLKVSVPGHETVFASDSIPSLFSEFTYLRFKDKAWLDDEGNQYCGLTFQIDDKPGQNFFEVSYRAEIYKYYSFWDSIVYSRERGSLYCFDPVIKEQSTYLMFNDATFDGKSIQLELMNYNMQWFYKDSIEFEIQVVQGSPSFYKYRLVFENHNSAQYSDFFTPVEPVIMYSNIENGYGIFAGYRSKYYQIDLSEYRD
jgi:hypothetical protein